MAIAKAQPKKFFTYQPGIGGSKLKLTGGQTLGHIQGKGYYAKPPPIPKTQVKVPAAVQPNWGEREGPGGGGNWNPGPNYGADLVGDPDFTEANAMYQENVSLAHQQRKNRVRAALIKLGFQPGSANAAALEGIDPETAQLAANNSASALAKLGLQRGKNRADLAADLANRGLLDSGALRGGENMVQSDYDTGLLGATEDYLNEQNTALGDEASTLATGQAQYSAAKAQAAMAAARNPLFTPTGDAGEQMDTLAPGQGVRPDQTPVLAKPPKVPVAVGPPPGAKLFVYKAQAQKAAKPGQTVKFHNGRYYLA